MKNYKRIKNTKIATEIKGILQADGIALSTIRIKERRTSEQKQADTIRQGISFMFNGDLVKVNQYTIETNKYSYYRLNITVNGRKENIEYLTSLV